MLVLPNFALRTLRHVVGVADVVLKFLFFERAHFATCVALHVWTMAPLLIQFANVFNVVAVGRGNLAGPFV